MSIIGYAVITNTRAVTPSGAAFADAETGEKKSKLYLDALAALVPAEVLGAHAGVISYLTKTENKVVTITYPDWLFAAFCGFVILSLLLYALPRYFGGRWDHWRDWIRMLIPAAAFVGWTMLQPMSAFDAVSSLPQGPRAACAILLALFLGLIATLLAYELDKKNPESRQSSA